MMSNENYNVMLAVNETYWRAKAELKQANLEIKSTPYMDYELRKQVNNRRVIHNARMMEAEYALLTYYALSTEELNNLLYDGAI